MSYWDFKNVFIGFKKGTNNENLVHQFMHCLDFEDCEIYGDDVVPYMLGYDYGYSILDYVDNPEWNQEDLLRVLNNVFKNVSYFSLEAEGSSCSDAYTGYEQILNVDTGIRKYLEFDYCYGDSTAFGEYICRDNDNEDVYDYDEDEDDDYSENYVDLEALGTRTGEDSFDPSVYTEKLSDSLLARVIKANNIAKEKGYIDLCVHLNAFLEKNR